MIALGLVILAFLLLRFLPIKLLTDNDFVVTDQYFHFFLSRIYRETGYRSPQAFERIDLAPPNQFYPPLFHLLCALLPPEKLNRYAYLFTPLLQFANLLVVIAAVFSLAPSLGSASAQSLAVFAAIAFTLNPFFFGPNSGLTFATPRPLGELLSNCFLICLLMISLGHSFFLWTCLAVIAFFLGGLTSRFGTQTNVFVGLLFSLLTLDLGVATALALSVAGSLSLGVAVYGPIAKYHWRHMITYLKVYSHHATDIEVLHTSTIAVIRQAWVQFRSGNLIDGLKRIYYSALLRLILMNPFAVFAMIGGAVFFPSLPLIIRQSYLLLLSGILTALLTMTKPLKFLGEGERYLEFGSMLALSLLCAYLTTAKQLDPVFWIIAIYALGFDLIAYKLHSRYSLPDRQELIEVLQSLGKSKILAFPTYTHPMVLFFSDLRVPYFDGWAYCDEFYRDHLKARELFEYIYGTYPGPNIETLAEQIDRFKVEYLLLCQAEGAYTYKANERYLGQHYTEIFRNNGYAVYAIAASSKDANLSGGNS